ncbi:transaldolase [Euzebya pacifica]|uniref:transaldolase n=1 Tax=Euzebya pacifica TaxID=1608957 RepID=UPI0030F59FB8
MSDKNPLQKIHDAGQAIWLDSIKRSYLGEGAYLDRLISAGEIHGLTSNPAIFAKAVAEDDTYDAQVDPMVEQGADAREILWAVMKDDIVAACDQFAAVYESSDGADGYVSIEVDPAHAFDTERTVSEALSLWQEIDRPNLMVKVPGTEPGLAAITRLIGEGLNVNVTLLFSVDRHRAVMDAYMAGLERRRDAGGKLDHIASVASFFVSRVDAKVDGLLPEGHDLRGKVAIANARAAYGAFLEVTASDRWQSLAADGAKPQRPLWASTSTKDPSLPDTLYVDELVGPQTVNTVPEPTMDATRDHGAEPTDNLNGRVDEALALLARLPELGVDLGQVTKELETEGVEKFVDSFEEAVATVAGAAD